MLGLLRAGAQQALTDDRAWDGLLNAMSRHLPATGTEPPRLGHLQRLGEEAKRILDKARPAIPPSAR
jgi:hypothetical protein